MKKFLVKKRKPPLISFCSDLEFPLGIIYVKGTKVGQLSLYNSNTLKEIIPLLKQAGFQIEALPSPFGSLGNDLVRTLEIKTGDTSESRHSNTIKRSQSKNYNGKGMVEKRKKKSL